MKNPLKEKTFKTLLESPFGAGAREMLRNYEVKKPRKDQERRELIERLSETTGRNKKSVYFSTMHFPISWLRDALSSCLHFQEMKTRNYHFGEFIKESKPTLIED